MKKEQLPEYPELKDFLLLWLSVIHAAKDLRDLSIKNISILDEGTNSYRLKVHRVGTFSFRFIDGEIRQLNYKDDFATSFVETSAVKKATSSKSKN